MKPMADKRSPTTRGRKATEESVAEAREGKLKKFNDVQSLMDDLNSDEDLVQEEVASSTLATTATTLASVNKKETNMSDVNSIMEFSEDVANAEAVPPLPVGDYPAEIRGAAKKISNTSGNEYAAVTFFIAPESYPADYTDGNPDGEVITFNLTGIGDTPKGRHKMRKFVEAIGAKAGKAIDMNDWVGLTATVAIGHDEWEGEKRSVIKKVVAA
jgi:hypothetical protein